MNRGNGSFYGRLGVDVSAAGDLGALERFVGHGSFPQRHYARHFYRKATAKKTKNKSRVTSKFATFRLLLNSSSSTPTKTTR